MNKRAYDQGCLTALATFKLAHLPDLATSALTTSGIIGTLFGGIPLASALAAGSAAPDGEGASDALLTGGGSGLGGLVGMAGGARLGDVIGKLTRPGSSGIRQGQKGFKFNGGLTGGLVGALAGLGLGQLAGAAAGHKLHRSWVGTDKPGPASPGEKTANSDEDLLHAIFGPPPTIHTVVPNTDRILQTAGGVGAGGTAAMTGALLASGLAGATADKGEAISDALLSGGGSLAGGLGGGVGGHALYHALGGRAPYLPLVLGGVLAGNIGGGLLGHKANQTLKARADHRE